MFSGLLGEPEAVRGATFVAAVPVAHAVKASNKVKAAPGAPGPTINITVNGRKSSVDVGVSSGADSSASKSKSSKKSKSGSEVSSVSTKVGSPSTATIQPTTEPELPPELGIDPLADIDQNINEGALREYLEKNGYPPGLIEIVTHSCIRAGPRYYIVDDSGSMDTGDGARVMYSDTRMGEANHIHCSRWEELGDSLLFHAGLITASNMVATFRFLNGPRINFPQDGEKGLKKIQSVLEDPPSGVTPLCKHLKLFIDEIEHNAHSLREHRRKAIICIFTDGAASDGELITVLNRLTALPVWLVVRLSTNETEVVDYWNSMDARLEVDMDILDDPLAEAIEVHRFNPWLSYSHYFHRIREFGVTLREVDSLDEQGLSPVQIRRLMARVCGVAFEMFPDPIVNLPAFLTFLHECEKKLHPKLVHNLFFKRPEPWFLANDLKQHIRWYGKKAQKSSCALL